MPSALGHQFNSSLRDFIFPETSKASSSKRVSIVQHWNDNRSSVDRKIQLQCESSRIGESNRLSPILGLDDIKCVELVGSLHYFAPRGFSAHVPRHCPLFSKRRFKELQIPNTAIRFILLFQNSPMNFYVKISFNVFIFIFFWKTMWYPQGSFLLFFQKSCVQTHVQKCHHVIWCKKQNVHWS